MKHLLLVSGSLLVGVASLAAQSAFAADTEAQARYRSERAVCLTGASNQDRATCLKEASAALAEARRGQLSSGDLAANSLARCEGLPGPDRDDCAQRIQRGATSGSVAAGGILREYSRPAN
jgi:hypothetical protein